MRTAVNSAYESFWYFLACIFFLAMAACGDDGDGNGGDPPNDSGALTDGPTGPVVDSGQCRISLMNHEVYRSSMA